MIDTPSPICDTSSSVLKSYGGRRVHALGLPDPSSFVLKATERRTGIEDGQCYPFAKLNIFTDRRKLYDYPQYQANPIVIDKWYTLAELSSKSIIDTTSVVIRLADGTESEYIVPDEFMEFNGSLAISAISLEPAKSSDLERIITPECREFCKSLNATDILNDCLYQVEQKFDSAESIEAELSYFHDDEQLDNEPHVVIEVKVNASWEIAEKSYDEWLDWFIESVPKPKRQFFILTIDKE